MEQITGSLIRQPRKLSFKVRRFFCSEIIKIIKERPYKDTILYSSFKIGDAEIKQ